MSDKGVFDFNSDATRELRAKNPLGVSVSNAFEWENVDTTKSVPNNKTGVSLPGVDDKLNDKLVIFKTTQDGLNAAAWLLKINYFDRGYTTPGAIGDRWAGRLPVPPNQFSDYALSLAKIMGLPPDSELTFGIDGIKVLKALARMENGTPFVIGIPDQMYQAAVAYALS